MAATRSIPSPGVLKPRPLAAVLVSGGHHDPHPCGVAGNAALSRSAIAFALLVFLLAGCGREGAAPASVDDLGRPVTLPPRIQRVITTAPNLTEMVFALGAEAKLVGVDDFSNFPPAAARLPKIGGMQPDVEKIVALRPDVVFASTEGNRPALAPALAAAGIPLYVVRNDRLAEVERAMDRLGRMLASPGRAAAVATVRTRIASQRRVRRTRPRVLFAVWTDPLYVGGVNTFIDDLLQLTGADNAVQVSGWPQYSLEALVADPPDLILYPARAVSEAQMSVLLERAGLSITTRGVDDDVFTRPGPRMADAAAELNAILDAWERRAAATAR